MKMKLFIVLVACLLLVRGEDAKSDEVKPQAEKDDIEGVLDEISKTDNQEKKDFLLGLAAHAIHGTLGAAHGAVNLVGHVLLGDEKTIDLKAVLDAISKTDNQEKKDFFLGLLHHAVRGVLRVGHHALNLVGHIVGDNKDVSLEDIEGVLDEISKTDNQEKKDFLLGLVHHAVRGVLGAAHKVVNLAGHILIGDEKTIDLKAVLDAISKTDNQEKKDFFLGLIHHAVRGVLRVGHHALNLVGHIAGDNKDVSLEDIEGVLDEISKTDNQEKKDFLLGLAAHAIHGTLGAAHGAVNLLGHVLIGDEKTTNLDDIFAAISETDNQDEKDFLLGLVHHYVRGAVGVLHHAVKFVGRVAGDDKYETSKDFLLGLAHHYVRGAVGVLHHAVNFVGHVLGDDKYETSEEIPTPQFDNYRTTERVY